MRSEDVAPTVRGLRARLGLTQEQFAQRLGVTYSTVNHWENGKRTPQPFLQARLLALRAEVEDAAPGEREEHRLGAHGSHLPTAIRVMVDRIVDRFSPEQVILFGSHARGDAGPDSDIDLLVVMEVEGSRRDQQLRVRRELHDVRVAKDVVVTSPEDYDWRRQVPGTVERAAVLEGKVVYARR